MMKAPLVPCVVCAVGQPAVGVLCGECSARLVHPVGISPEQLRGRTRGPRAAVLIDEWGQVHWLINRAYVGRSERSALAILDGAISRRHALIARNAAGQWSVRDLGSRNGTFVDGERLEGAAPLSSGCVVAFAEVRLYFVSPANRLVGIVGGRSSAATRASTPPGGGGEPADGLRLIEPAGGGGGFVLWRGERAPLTTIQLELVRVLADRWRADSAEADLVRGFVRSSELGGRLPWDTPHPGANHVKQLIRRTRRALAAAGVDLGIEARRSLGYRLAWPSSGRGPVTA